MLTHRPRYGCTSGDAGRDTLDRSQSDLAVPLLGETVNRTRSAQAAEFLLRSVMQHGHAVPYWFEMAVQSGVSAEEILVESLNADAFRTRAAAITALAWPAGALPTLFARVLSPGWSGC